MRFARFECSFTVRYCDHRLSAWRQRAHAALNRVDGGSATTDSFGATFVGRWLLRILGGAVRVVSLGKFASAEAQRVAGGLRRQPLRSRANERKCRICFCSVDHRVNCLRSFQTGPRERFLICGKPPRPSARGVDTGRAGGRSRRVDLVLSDVCAKIRRTELSNSFSRRRLVPLPDRFHFALAFGCSSRAGCLVSDRQGITTRCLLGAPSRSKLPRNVRCAIWNELALCCLLGLALALARFIAGAPGGGEASTNKAAFRSGRRHFDLGRRGPVSVLALLRARTDLRSGLVSIAARFTINQVRSRSRLMRRNGISSAALNGTWLLLPPGRLSMRTSASTLSGIARQIFQANKVASI